jgi:hypothetical protein
LGKCHEGIAVCWVLCLWIVDKPALWTERVDVWAPDVGVYHVAEVVSPEEPAVCWVAFASLGIGEEEAKDM